MPESGRISRRTFITSGVVVAAGGATVTSFVTGVTPGRLIDALFGDSSVALRRSTFTPLLNQSFTMSNSDGSASVVLREISDLQPVRVANDEDRFSLLFHAPLGSDLDQGVYTFDNPYLGSVVLLAVPVDQVHTDRHYEVVVNRATDTPPPDTTTTTSTTTPPTTEPPTTTPPTTEPPTTEPPTTSPPITAPPVKSPPTTTATTTPADTSTTINPKG